jgi:1,4-dihydroxy-2-naphthoate octaprenyltransferase
MNDRDTDDGSSLEHERAPRANTPFFALWVSGARPRTLTLSVVPVILGTAAASTVGAAHLGLAGLALLTSLCLQIGVNYSNDYSDGVRGTDRYRVGPPRLTGSGAAQASHVLAAAISFYVLGAASGVAIVVLSQHWWLLIVGGAALAAAWLYTGGSRPYGYSGLGEPAVFIFFGLVATCGTEYIQAQAVSVIGVISAAAAGFFACAVLMVNNIRDIEQDAQAGKRTLGVKLGSRRARIAYLFLLIAPYVLGAALAIHSPWVLLVFLSVPMSVRAATTGLRSVMPRELVAALKLTSFTALFFAVLLAVGLVLSAAAR